MIDLLQEAINSLIASLESGVGFDQALYRYSLKEQAGQIVSL